MPKITFDTFTLQKLLDKKNVPPRNDDGSVAHVEYWDISQPGFGLRLSSSGAATWQMFTRVLINGTPRQRRLKIGAARRPGRDFGLTLAVARAKADGWRDTAKRGEDPRRAEIEAIARAAEESRMTFGTAALEFLEWCERRTKNPCRPGTVKLYRRALIDKCTRWKERPVGSITKREVAGRVNELVEAGHDVAANRTFSALRKFFRWAASRGKIDAVPTDHLEAPGSEAARERHLFGVAGRGIPSELPLAWRAFEQAGLYCVMFKLLLVTGQRRDEVAGMSDSELFDLQGHRPYWVIPADRAKNKREHVVPLGPLAVSLIKSATRIEGSALLFPSSTGVTHLTSYSKAKAAVDRAAAALREAQPRTFAGQLVQPWTLHDLRRTFSTGLAELGVWDPVIDVLTNHVSGESKKGVRRHYNHATHDELARDAMLKWERHILQQVGVAISEKIYAAA